LCVVGDGPLGNVYRRKLSERVAGDVIWAGRVDWSRPRYYASADIHCTPCQRASFGMVLLEAMATGRPVVASRISGFQLLMEHGKQGLLVSPADDANRFAQALLYLLDRPAERARMGREGRVTAVTLWSSVAAQLEPHTSARGQTGIEMRSVPSSGASSDVDPRSRRRRPLAAVVGWALVGWAGWAFFALVCLLVLLWAGGALRRTRALRQGRHRAGQKRPPR
jgi:hypothetical protein